MDTCLMARSYKHLHEINFNKKIGAFKLALKSKIRTEYYFGRSLRYYS